VRELPLSMNEARKRAAMSGQAAQQRCGAADRGEYC
jgi:hypothetical protein